MAVQIANDWGSRRHVQTFVLMAATAFGIYLCYQVALPFLPAIAWAMALSVLFTPFQRWLDSKLKHPSIATFVSVLVIGLIVIVTAIFVGQRLVLQATKGAELIEMKVKSGEWRRFLESQPRLVPIADRIEQHIDLPGTVQTLANWLSTTAGSIVKGSVFQVIDFFLTFYLLFYFLRDRRVILQSFRTHSPLTEAEMGKLFGQIGNTIFATIYGMLVVSTVQGMLGGLMFWWLGLSAPFLWGVIMALLSLIPVMGAVIVWSPAALFLALEGSWVKALILILWGMTVVGTIDNLLRPILVGNRLKLHSVLVFMSVVGGLLLFGSAGIIIGPVTLTITTVLLEIWSSRTMAETIVRIDH
ncbi:MAG: AI-2E family transporter [Desulfobacterales bacterium]|nr:AI-2E family transporter [Desulfobacterales bacterium]